MVLELAGAHHTIISAAIFFTPKGNVYLWNSGCKNLSGIVTP
jgi:hypothetical protein